MNDPNAPNDPRHDEQQELDRDAAIADLSQAVADREQAIGDLEQRRIDSDEQSLDEDESSGGSSAGDDVRQRLQLVAAQRRRDAHQQSLDEGQRARDDHMSSLDEEQRQLNLPMEIRTTLTEDELHAASRSRYEQAEARAVAAEQRAEAALQRARAARARAQAHADRIHPTEPDDPEADGSQ